MYRLSFPVRLLYFLGSVKLTISCEVDNSCLDPSRTRGMLSVGDFLEEEKPVRTIILKYVCMLQFVGICVVEKCSYCIKVCTIVCLLSFLIVYIKQSDRWLIRLVQVPKVLYDVAWLWDICRGERHKQIRLRFFG